MGGLGADGFDFWLGTWDCKRGQDTISREFDGAMSLSVHDAEFDPGQQSTQRGAISYSRRS